MTGKPGRSGGRRAGAGRPPKSFTFRPEHGLIIYEHDEDGRYIGPSRCGQVTEITRTQIVVTLYNADNNPTGTLTIRRFA